MAGVVSELPRPTLTIGTAGGVGGALRTLLVPTPTPGSGEGGAIGARGLAVQLGGGDSAHRGFTNRRELGDGGTGRAWGCPFRLPQRLPAKPDTPHMAPHDAPDHTLPARLPFLLPGLNGDEPCCERGVSAPRIGEGIPRNGDVGGGTLLAGESVRTPATAPTGAAPGTRGGFGALGGRPLGGQVRERMRGGALASDVRAWASDVRGMGVGGKSLGTSLDTVSLEGTGSSGLCTGTPSAEGSRAIGLERRLGAGATGRCMTGADETAIDVSRRGDGTDCCCRSGRAGGGGSAAGGASGGEG